MLRKRYAGLIALATLPGLAGCAQATRHSNTMVFGTNTTVGLKAGRDVNQMPAIMLAYDRQEAVIMPLLANTGEKSGSSNLLSPCPATTSPTPTPTPTPPASLASPDAYAHPCKFVAIRKGKDGLAIQDSYSVLASFGARIEGEAAEAKGAVGIAQYFATGAAAQTLAMTGGAAVVAVGEGAENSASNETGKVAAAAALGGETVPTFEPANFDSSWGKLNKDIAQAATPQARADVMTKALDPIQMGPETKRAIVNACRSSKDACLKEIAESISLFSTPTFTY